MARSPSRKDNARFARDRRDDRDLFRRRSRSRDRDHRPNDRDIIRRRGSFDRHDGRLSSYDRTDEPRGSRRDRSGDGQKSSEASPGPVRDRRADRVRPRDDRDYDDRDRKRPRRDERSPPPRRDTKDRDRRETKHSSRGPNREVRAITPRSQRDTQLNSHQRSRPRSHTSEAEEKKKKPEEDAKTAAELAAEKDKKEKLARVEAWKQKTLLNKKMQEAGSSNVASPKDSTAAASPDVSSPATATQSPIGGKPASATTTTRFDPKAIARRAAEKLEAHKATLGGDVVIPKSANATSNTSASTQADPRKVARAGFGNAAAGSSVDKSLVAGFGLNKGSSEIPAGSNVNKRGATLDDEDGERKSRKIRELPDLPAQSDMEDAALANVTSDQDDGDNMSSDEDINDAAREAAQKRAFAMQAEQHDVTMANGENAVVFAAESKTTTALSNDAANQMDEDEDIDPLDAFMAGIDEEVGQKQDSFADLGLGRLRKNQPRLYNSDDDEPDYDTVQNNDDDLMAIAAKSKRKEMPKTDHSKMNYDDFRKNFYTESEELTNMTDEELEVARAELDNIKVHGADVPKPIFKWSQAGFGAQIADVIRDQKFELPTPIQSQALPAIMSGRDVIGVAKTGSGKTLAFILPMLRHIKDQRPIDNSEGPIGLIIAPTRELAVQIHKECQPYVKALKLRAVCAYGGSPIKAQIADFKRGCEIVVCTPGRMIEMLAANGGRVTNLHRVTYVVLDEADRMFDMGFEPQVMKMLKNIRPDRQTVLFSATFPKIMESLAKKELTKPVEIIVGGRSVVAPEIKQLVEVRSEQSKFHRLLKLLGEVHSKDDDARSLIFMEKQESCDAMVKALFVKGYPSNTIHGGRPQDERDTTIVDFKAGVNPIMIATSVAARGLDVKQLKLVVNFDCPNHIEDYVHRAGRTGRAGNTGLAVTFVTPEQDKYAQFLIKALTDSKQDIPEELLKMKATHDEKVKAGTAKKSGKGFGGRGIERLDAARDSERAAARKVFKTDDEPDEEEEGESAKKDSKESAIDKLVAKAASSVTQTDAGSGSNIIPSLLADHLNNAMNVQKTERPTSSSGGRAADPLSRVNAAAASINSRLSAKGSSGSGRPADNRGPDAGAFHANLEINDFPQKARWAVTNRTNVAKILDATSTSITNKGNFYPPGKEPGPGEPPKLYILVEGDTELQVRDAMQELTRSLRDGTIQALSEEARAPVGGRYNVV